MPLTDLQKQHGPFARPSVVPGWTHVTVCSVAERMDLVKASTDVEWLSLVLTHAEQKTVRKAAARRINALNRLKK
jgi:hypothetical protein